MLTTDQHAEIFWKAVEGMNTIGNGVLLVTEEEPKIVFALTQIAAALSQYGQMIGAGEVEVDIRE